MMLKQIAEILRKRLGNCFLCPRKCGVNRLRGQKGFCKLGPLPVVSSYNPHFGEEPVLVGKGGSGTIFFTSCNLACEFCQNFDVSHMRLGKEISHEELADIMLSLQEQGCENINLVTPTPQVAAIVQALAIAVEEGLSLPIVYNTGTFDSVETLQLLDGIIDIYMPDAKYADKEIAERLSLTPDYPEIMQLAIREMHRQVGDLKVKDGKARKGLLVRHLVLPNKLAGSKDIFSFLSNISKNTYINLMDQYRPCFKASEHPELTRRITREEFDEAVSLAKEAGLSRLD